MFWEWSGLLAWSFGSPLIAIDMLSWVKNVKAMLRYLTFDVCSLASFVSIRPSTHKLAGVRGGLAWSMTYNRLFVGINEVIDVDNPRISRHIFEAHNERYV